MIAEKPHFSLSPFNKKRILILAVCFVLLNSAIIAVFMIHEYMLNERYHLVKSLNATMLRNGDIIFRRGKSLTSELVLLTDRSSDYSHVGLVFFKNKIPYVIHAVPDESGKFLNKIRMEKLTDFLDMDHASKACIYRLKATYKTFATKAAEKAKSFFDRKLEFDDYFDLNSDNKLYCTELVWKAYKRSGIDLIQGKFDKLFLPLKRGNIILPGTILKSTYLKKIYTINPDY